MLKTLSATLLSAACTLGVDASMKKQIVFHNNRIILSKPYSIQELRTYFDSYLFKGAVIGNQEIRAREFRRWKSPVK